MHADRAVHAVIGDDPNDLETILCGGCHFLTGHEQAAIASEHDHVAIGMNKFRGNPCRRSVAHRSAGRCQLGFVAPILVISVNPDTVIAGTVGDNRVVGQGLIEMCDDRPEIEGTGDVLWLEARQIFLTCCFREFSPPVIIDGFQAEGSTGEGGWPEFIERSGA